MIIVITLAVWRSVDIWSEDRASRSEPTSAAAKLRPGEPRDWSFGRRRLGRTPQLRFLVHFCLHLALWPVPLTTFCLVDYFHCPWHHLLSLGCPFRAELLCSCGEHACPAAQVSQPRRPVRMLQRGHPAGNSVPCDREVITLCIRKWFGSESAFERLVTTDVSIALASTLGDASFSYVWLLMISAPMHWAYVDQVATRLHSLEMEAAAVTTIFNSTYYFVAFPLVGRLGIVLACKARRQRQQLWANELMTCAVYLAIFPVGTALLTMLHSCKTDMTGFSRCLVVEQTHQCSIRSRP